MAREFRFGVVTTAQGSEERWRGQCNRIAELGYSSLVMPDGMQLLSPIPALAVAAATVDLRVGTFVLAAPLRPAHSTAWDAHTLTVLTGGRFEMGIGAGLPRVQESVERLGLPYGSGSERLAQVEAAIDALRELDGDEHHTPVLVAAGGPKALALAGCKADIVTLAAGPLTSPDEMARMADEVRSAAGNRADELELAINIFVVGEEVPPQLARYLKVDVQTLAANSSLALLRGSVDAMADELSRRRERLGFSYILVGEAFCAQLAPVAKVLAGR